MLIWEQVSKPSRAAILLPPLVVALRCITFSCCLHLCSLVVLRASCSLHLTSLTVSDTHLQPHMIWVPELEYVGCSVNVTKAPCEQEVLQRLKTVVDATARMMASYLSYDTTDRVYRVGPPVAGAAEGGMDCRGMKCQRVSDPTFELTQFAVTLSIANEWRARLGQPKNQTWALMATSMAPAPTIQAPSAAPVGPVGGPGAVWLTAAIPVDNPYCSCN